MGLFVAALAGVSDMVNSPTNNVPSKEEQVVIVPKADTDKRDEEPAMVQVDLPSPVMPSEQQQEEVPEVKSSSFEAPVLIKEEKSSGTSGSLESIDIPDGSDLSGAASKAVENLNVPDVSDLTGVASKALENLNLPDSSDLSGAMSKALENLPDTSDLSGALSNVLDNLNAPQVSNVGGAVSKALENVDLPNVNDIKKAVSNALKDLPGNTPALAAVGATLTAATVAVVVGLSKDESTTSPSQTTVTKGKPPATPSSTATLDTDSRTSEPKTTIPKAETPSSVTKPAPSGSSNQAVEPQTTISKAPTSSVTKPAPSGSSSSSVEPKTVTPKAAGPSSATKPVVPTKPDSSAPVVTKTVAAKPEEKEATTPKSSTRSFTTKPVVLETTSPTSASAKPVAEPTEKKATPTESTTTSSVPKTDSPAHSASKAIPKPKQNDVKSGVTLLKQEARSGPPKLSVGASRTEAQKVAPKAEAETPKTKTAIPSTTSNVNPVSPIDKQTISKSGSVTANAKGSSDKASPAIPRDEAVKTVANSAVPTEIKSATQKASPTPTVRAQKQEVVQEGAEKTNSQVASNPAPSSVTQKVAPTTPTTRSAAKVEGKLGVGPTSSRQAAPISSTTKPVASRSETKSGDTRPVPTVKAAGASRTAAKPDSNENVTSTQPGASGKDVLKAVGTKTMDSPISKPKEQPVAQPAADATPDRSSQSHVTPKDAKPTPVVSTSSLSPKLESKVTLKKPESTRSDKPAMKASTQKVPASNIPSTKPKLTKRPPAQGFGKPPSSKSKAQKLGFTKSTPPPAVSEAEKPAVEQHNTATKAYMPGTERPGPVESDSTRTSTPVVPINTEITSKVIPPDPQGVRRPRTNRHKKHTEPPPVTNGNDPAPKSSPRKDARKGYLDSLSNGTEPNTKTKS